MLNKVHQIHQTELSRRDKLVKTAAAELGVREVGGNNKGARIAEYLAVVKLKRPEPWCSAFVCWVFAQNGYKNPCSGWSPDLFLSSSISTTVLPGNIIGFYFPNLKRIAHVGLIVNQKDSWILTTEGNTNVKGSREGDGVYLRMRHRREIYRIADWVSERRIKK